MSNALHWWQKGAIYQLLVPSFLDTNGDGFGDLNGVLERLDYLQWLGVGGVWLSPIYPSPFADLGYDIIDFESIHPGLGTLEDFDRLVAEAHRRDLKIVLDWVPNHTSDEHPWFKESCSSRESPKRDWYIWRDAKPDGSPPNNWVSVFGGSVWKWDEATEQFYMHSFLDKQPDLNWRNTDVQQAMLANLRFWMDRDVDGFRVDAATLLIKDAQFRDNPPNPDFKETDAPDTRLIPKYTHDQPDQHQMMAMMRRAVDEYGDDRLLTGEFYLPLDRLVTYYGDEQPELHLPLNLSMCFCQWELKCVADPIAEYWKHLPKNAWPTWTISTHDGPRVAARGNVDAARLAAMLQLTLPGTPTIYYGEEVGMQGTEIPPAHAIDPQGRRTGRNRDPSRTPMQWSAEPNAGFSQDEPWLPVSEDHATANVAKQADDPRSLLTLYRRLLSLRASESTLVEGSFDVLQQHDGIYAYQRQGSGQQLLTVLNFTEAGQTCQPSSTHKGRLLLSTELDREGEVAVEGRWNLRPFEGLLIQVD